MSYPHWAFTPDEWRWITDRFWRVVDWAYLVVTAPVVLTARWVLVGDDRGRHLREENR